MFETAGALAAFSSAANAGITIPAGDWTVDIGGVVNAYYTSTNVSGSLAHGTAPLGVAQPTVGNTASSITTGLLPNYLAVSGKSRQNDLDIAFTISLNPGGATVNALDQSSHQENRQAFVTVGDASWGSVKLGKDLGIFASDAILNDMTLLGVGSNAGALSGASNTTTTGRIGTGFIYADWKEQIAYTSPNWNGFQFTAGVTNAFNAAADADAGGAHSTGRGGSEPAFEGKASYSFTADQVTGKVWVSGISQKVEGLTNAVAGSIAAGGNTVTGYAANTATNTKDRADAFDIGATATFAGINLVGYYYDGSGIGQTGQLHGGFDATGKSRDSNGGYVQATYVLPTSTKVGVSWGESNLDGNSGEAFKSLKDEMWTVGAYHPLTKSLNLVAEYSYTTRQLETTSATTEGKSKTVALGAILFF